MASAPEPKEGCHGRIQVLVINATNSASTPRRKAAGILAKARG
jgi:hypothetical protein